jgi:nitrite reductase (NADH) large subunit
MKGIGTAYANVQHITLVNHGINVIYLKAGHYSSRFWTKMGYSFIDPDRFWMHYQEYCERGIVVNDSLQSYDPNIYAVGECVQHRGDTFGLVAPLFEQAKVCATHLGGQSDKAYVNLPTAVKLKVTGIHLFSIGDFHGELDCEKLIFSDSALGIYKKLVLKDDKLVGAVLYGDTADGVWYQQLLEQKTNISSLREGVIFGKDTQTQRF